MVRLPATNYQFTVFFVLLQDKTRGRQCCGDLVHPLCQLCDPFLRDLINGAVKNCVLREEGR